MQVHYITRYKFEKHLSNLKDKVCYFGAGSHSVSSNVKNEYAYALYM